MYAIIKTGGKQYKVENGDVIKVEKLDGEPGEVVSFETLMTVNGETVKVGDPLLKGVEVKGKIIAHDKAKKVIVFKYKPKTDFRKKQGHRQPYTKVEITEIDGVGSKKTAATKDDTKAVATDAAKKPAAKKAEEKSVAEKKPAAKKTEEKPAAAKKPAAKKTEEKPAAAKKPAAKKTEEKPAAAKKPVAKKTEEKPAAAKKPVAKKTEEKSAAEKKPVAKKTEEKPAPKKEEE